MGLTPGHSNYLLHGLGTQDEKEEVLSLQPVCHLLSQKLWRWPGDVTHGGLLACHVQDLGFHSQHYNSSTDQLIKRNCSLNLGPMKSEARQDFLWGSPSMDVLFSVLPESRLAKKRAHILGM